MYGYAQHPLSIGRVLDSGFRLYAHGFGRVVGLAVVAALLGLVPVLAGLLFPLEEGRVHIARIVHFAAVITASLLSIVVYSAIYHRLHGCTETPDTTLEAAVAVGLRTFFRALAASIVYGIVVLVAMGLLPGLAGLAALGAGVAPTEPWALSVLVLLALPGLVLALSLALYWPLIVVGGAGVIESLRVSHRLVWGNWWRTATVFTVPVGLMVVGYVVAGIAGGAASLLLRAPSAAELELLFNLASAVLTVLLTPLGFAVVLVQLNDLRLRRHGEDLKARLAG